MAAWRGRRNGAVGAMSPGHPLGQDGGADVNLRIKCRRFRRDETAATALEYCLIAALIGLAIIAGASAFGTSINAGYSDIAGSIPSN